MDPQSLVFILVFAGIVLIFAEVCLPTGGIIGVLCLFCFLASGYYAYEAWFYSAPFFWWMYLGSVAVLIPSSIIGGFTLLARTSLGNRVLLTAPTEEEVTPHLREQQHLTSLIGKRGTALNLMTPGGMVRVQGERIHAVSEGMMIEPDSPIEIISVRGTRVVVRPIPEDSQQNDLTRLADEETGNSIKDSDTWGLSDNSDTSNR
ncbi:MAG TPA: NfeD family protein [Planctomicrobium sp.]|nr:NfeD family protein [Planctomicrobium sp.]